MAVAQTILNLLVETFHREVLILNLLEEVASTLRHIPIRMLTTTLGVDMRHN